MGDDIGQAGRVMRIATYNVEWFARLFDDRDRLYNDDGWSSRWQIKPPLWSLCFRRLMRMR